MNEQRCLHCGADRTTMLWRQVFDVGCADPHNPGACVPWFFEERITFVEMMAMYKAYTKEETT